MDSTRSWIRIFHEKDIVEARQLGRNMTKSLGFGNVDQVRITTVISELARNIFLYAPGGEIALESVYEPRKTGIAIIAKDQGPGIEDVRKVLEDGYTTSGGLGAGLPGVKRIMDDFMIRTVKGEGTVIEAKKWLNVERKLPLFGGQEDQGIIS
ncbi:MAG TPA: anti-sigma regulatory factor [Bacillales bacterium]|nr:anti-sigma regulatory factor [Bacillales bacterium]